jgi:hypothetical protein
MDPAQRGLAMTLHRRAGMLTLVALFGSGCGVAPKHFKRISDPAPIVRARSVGLGGQLPQHRVVPALIDRLEDKDPVVRMAAYEELKKGTGRSFGFIPWGNDADRAGAVARWRAWWKERQAGLARLGQKL